jgi:hypothetical protein
MVGRETSLWFTRTARDKYTVIETVPTFAGAKTIVVDPASHNAYLFQPERGPAPTPAPGTDPAPAAGGRGVVRKAPIAWPGSLPSNNSASTTRRFREQ